MIFVPSPAPPTRLSLSFPALRASACNAPKWLPWMLQWRQGQLAFNTGDRSIQKPENEASCNVKDWCPLLLMTREGGNLLLDSSPGLCYRIVSWLRWVCRGGLRREWEIEYKSPKGLTGGHHRRTQWSEKWYINVYVSICGGFISH